MLEGLIIVRALCRRPTTGRLGYAVDNDQRVIVGRQGGAAADTDGGAAGGVTTVGGNDKTGGSTYEEVLGGGGEAGLDIVGFDNCNRTGGVGFLHGAVTDGNNFVELHAAVAHLHVDSGAVSYGHALGLHTHIRHDEGGVGGAGYGKFTIDVRGGTGGGAFH